MNNRSLLAAAAALALSAGAALAQSTNTHLDQALDHFRAQHWEEAASAFKEVVAAAPQDAQSWENYGYALHQLKRYDEAIAAFSISARTGQAPGTSLYNIACGKALQGKTSESLDYLDRALKAGFRDFGTIESDTDLAGLRADPRFLAIAGAPPPDTLSRDDKWRFDIDRLVLRIGQVHYRPDRKVARDDLARAAADLKSRVPTLSDQCVALGIQRLLAMVGDGHTGLQNLAHGPIEFQRYPAGFYLFSDGLYIYGARDQAVPFVGAKVLKVGNLTADEALARVEPLCSVDNAMGIRSQTPRWLAMPDALAECGVLDKPGPVELTLFTPAGETKTITLNPDTGASIGHPAEPKPGIVFAHEAAKAELPLYMRRTTEPQWFEHLPDLGGGAVYFRFGGVVNPRASSLRESCDKLFALIDDKKPGYLVIDVRDNGGGNNTLLRPLIHGLIRRPEISSRGRLFVITGRRTFSAAVNAIVRLERELDPIFVGEPPGSSPNFVGETTIVTLPATDLVASISSLYWQDSQPWDRRPWITPDLPAETSSADFANNRDPAMDAIAAAIKANPAK